jgi:hypothetical protein
MTTGFEDAGVGAVVDALVQMHGEASRERAARGVRQAAAYWRADDGTFDEFQAFCREHFLADPAALDAMFARYRKNLEALAGHEVAMTRALREEMDLDLTAPLPVDVLFATLNPFDHLAEDVFSTKVAFTALLNFPQVELTAARDLSRREWAEARLTQSFAMRIPGDVLQARTQAYTLADDYIARYNIHLDGLVTGEGKRPFAGGPSLISHWGLRDHIKALYAAGKDRVPDQRLIVRVMERIVRQEIPAAVIDNPGVDWDPVTNAVLDRATGKPLAQSDREPDRRFARLLDVFHAEQRVDPWSPRYPNLIGRKFGLEREIPEAEVEALLVSVVDAPVARDVARLIRGRLGRPLEVFDIWYDGFKARSRISEDVLNARVKDRYPTREAFEAGIPEMMQRLDFDPETIKSVAARITVDPSRGAGHAMGAGMRTDNAHLRTRVPRDGLNYKGYNIAMHELGHCIEQVLTLNHVDDTLLQGVPNTAFTEAFAFVFQRRDLEILDLDEGDASKRALEAIDTYWMTYEIAGVALLDMAVWRWMYANPDATPEALRTFVVGKAIELWNRYYAPVLGVKDSPILAIYSHMISNGLYLPDYPIGHIIEFQIEKQFEGRSLGREMERMCVQGRITPDAWMRGAVGSPLSTKPLIDAARAALKVLK